jgi:outer membrane receptor for ferrienterochelin and colicin
VGQKHSSRLVAFWVSSAALTVGVSAQEATQLERIVISGKADRLCLPVSAPREAGDTRARCVGEGVARENLPGSTIDRTQYVALPTGPRVQDAVKRLPGVVTGGAPGEDKDARVLGLDKEYTRTTVDGIQIPDGGEKREFNLDRLSTVLVDSVDVIRGRRAEMDGDGIAGRIDIKLRDIPATVGWEASTAIGGSSDGHPQHWHSIVGGGMLTPNFGAQGGFAFSDQAVSKTKDKFDADGNLVEQERETKPVTSRDLLLDMLWQNDANAIRFKPMILDQVETKDKTKTKFKDGAPNGSETELEHKRKQTVGGTLSWRHDFDGLSGASLETRAAYYFGSEDKDKTKRVFKKDGSEDLGKFERETENKSDTILQGEAAMTLPLELFDRDHELKFGGLARYKDRRKDKQKFDIDGDPIDLGVKDTYALDEVVLAGFIQDKISLSDRLRIVPGLRVEGAWLDATARSGATGDGATVDFLPSLPVEFQLSERWTLNASAAGVVNRPKFDLLIPYEEERGDRFVIGNPDLRPERGWAFDADLTYQATYLSLGLGLFHRELSGIIEEVDTGLVRDGKTIYMPENVGDGWTNGVILSERVSFDFLDVAIIDGFAVSATQTFAQSQLREDATGDLRPFNEQPKFWADVALEWTDPSRRFYASATLGYTGKVAKSGDGAGEYREAELSLDAQVRYRITDNIEIFALGENLTGTKRIKVKSDGTREVESGPVSFFAGMKAKF